MFGWYLLHRDIPDDIINVAAQSQHVVDISFDIHWFAV